MNAAADPAPVAAILRGEMADLARAMPDALDRHVTMSIVCPKCDTDVPAGDLHGIEVPGVYDGVLLWRHHGECGHTWPRFPSGRLHAEAVRLIERGV